MVTVAVLKDVTLPLLTLFLHCNLFCHSSAVFLFESLNQCICVIHLPLLSLQLTLVFLVYVALMTGHICDNYQAMCIYMFVRIFIVSVLVFVNILETSSERITINCQRSTRRS